MRKTNNYTAMLATSLAALALAGCDTGIDIGDDVEKFCNEYCDTKTTKEKPGVFLMMKDAVVNGQKVSVPMRDIMIEGEDGTLVTPYNASYGNSASGDGLPNPDKTVGLDPSCFATEPYETPNLSQVDLTEENTTITFVNFDRNGRVESRDLLKTDPAYKNIESILGTTSTGEYLTLQQNLSQISRPDVDALFVTGNGPGSSAFKRRNLTLNQTPPEKTPFFTDLSDSTYKDSIGHIFFYVLLDEHLTFSRDTAALVTYAPNSESALGQLFTPFVQYPVYPKNPSPDALDVLTFHFIRHKSMQSESGGTCRYRYDKYVISAGQQDHFPSTPLFIDPEVQTEGIGWE